MKGLEDVFVFETQCGFGGVAGGFAFLVCLGRLHLSGGDGGASDL